MESDRAKHKLVKCLRDEIDGSNPVIRFVLNDVDLNVTAIVWVLHLPFGTGSQTYIRIQGCTVFDNLENSFKTRLDSHNIVFENRDKFIEIQKYDNTQQYDGWQPANNQPIDITRKDMQKLVNDNKEAYESNNFMKFKPILSEDVILRSPFIADEQLKKNIGKEKVLSLHRKFLKLNSVTRVEIKRMIFDIKQPQYCVVDQVFKGYKKNTEKKTQFEDHDFAFIEITKDKLMRHYRTYIEHISGEQDPFYLC